MESDQFHIDFDQMMLKIREEVARRNFKDGRVDELKENRSSEPLNSPFKQIDYQIEAAEKVSHIGTKIPEMKTFKGAVKVAKIVLRLAEIITRDQRTYNSIMIEAVRNINLKFTTGLSQIDHLTELVHQQKIMIEKLKADVSQNRTRLNDSEQKDVISDALYKTFEDTFRGSCAEIKERQKIYLPTIQEVRAGTKESPIVDLGSGRGEWLELLKENDFIAKGIDSNDTMVSTSLEKGLEVEKSDILEYLKKLPDNSVGAITGFHIAEHLQFGKLLQVLEEVKRVLQRDGVVILESPNPKNLFVGACEFYIDPTHFRPLHPYTLKFFIEDVGFKQVKVIELNPIKPEQKIVDDILVSKGIDVLIYGPQDFAVVAYKE